MLIPHSNNFHPEVDIESAVELFRQLPNRLRDKVRVVTGPIDLASVEFWRRHFDAELKLRDGPILAADYFVWSRGEPNDPRQTKIGGIPFWPAGRKWPVSSRGPYRFLAQFNFTDSRDILPELPGDILVILAMTETFLYDGSHLEFIWLAGTEEFAPIHVPGASSDDAAFFGNIHRTFDFPAASKYEHIFVRLVNSFQLAVGEATKIGGAAPLGGEPPAGKLLCQLILLCLRSEFHISLWTVRFLIPLMTNVHLLC